MLRYSTGGILLGFLGFFAVAASPAAVVYTEDFATGLGNWSRPVVGPLGDVTWDGPGQRMELSWSGGSFGGAQAHNDVNQIVIFQPGERVTFEIDFEFDTATSSVAFFLIGTGEIGVTGFRYNSTSLVEEFFTGTQTYNTAGPLATNVTHSAIVTLDYTGTELIPTFQINSETFNGTTVPFSGGLILHQEVAAFTLTSMNVYFDNARFELGTTPVPEPAGALLVFVASGCFVCRRRR